MTIHTQPPPPPPRPAWKLAAVIGVAGVLAGGVLGGSITAATASNPGDAPAACIEALGDAEAAFEVYQNGFLDVADTMDAYQANDYNAMRRGNDSLTGRVAEIEVALEAYYDNSGKCLR